MKRALLGTTAVVGAGLVGLGGAASPAAAAEPIKLTVGGFFREAYMFVSDDDAQGEPGDNRNEHGFFNDAEIHFRGRTVLDNGLEVGARIELEGETDNDQIDEAWVYFAGGFGEIRIGSDDEALENSCILPPGGTANFSAFSPNQWGANAFSTVIPVFGLFGVHSNSACSGVDDKSDAQKIIYFSPVFYGFQLSASYTPDPAAETHVDGVGPHIGMPVKDTTPFSDDTPADADASVYLTYTYEGSNWGLTWGGGASWEISKNNLPTPGFFRNEPANQDFYQTALTVNIDRFSIGGVFEYYNDILDLNEDHFDFRVDQDAWVAGGGVSYNYNAWTFGAQYSYRKDRFQEHFPGTDFKADQVQQRAVATVNYVLGTGINLDGEVGYTWRNQSAEHSFGIDDQDYAAFEVGLGTAITF